MRTQSHSRASGRSRAVLAGLTAIAAAGLVLSGVGASTAIAAPPAQTTFVNESFTGSNAGSGYLLPSTQSGATNMACLTAAPTTAPNTGSIPTCAGASDLEGQGALRLTTATNNQVGGVGVRQSVPITKGVDAVFNSYQYNGSANGYGGTADGIVFYLAATDPYNPAVPQRIGGLGGSLGYSASAGGGVSGLSNAYLGIGLDRYGNFVNNVFGGSGCSGDASTPGYRVPNSVTVRGPGNGTTGYCVLATQQVNGSLSATNVTNRAAANTPVEIVINPTSSTLTAQNTPSVTVAPGTYAVIYTSIGGQQQVLKGALPQLNGNNNPAGIPASWIDPATGYPYKLTYGWVAGTGGANDVHEVNYLKATTLAGPVPVLSAQSGGSTTVAHAGSGTYTVTPTVTADGGSESQKVRATTTFPTGVTPVLNGSSVGDGWSCTASGQVVTCDQAISASSPVAPGTTLPTLSIPYTVSGSARSASISSVVASTDAEAVTTSTTVAIAPQGTTVTTSDSSTTVGSPATLTATVASTAGSTGTVPTGTVTFTDSASGNVLCSASVRSDGTASCTTPTSSVGTSSFLVGYSGDSDHVAVSGTDRPTGSLTVTKIATAISVNAAPAPATYGTPVTLTVAGLPSGATGTVTFTEAGTTLCSVALPATSCVATGLSAGTHTVGAHYSGDATYGASDAAPVSVNVTKAITVLSAPGTPSSPSHGTSTKLDTPNVPTDATGTIDYVTDDGTVLCTATLPDTACDTPTDLAGGVYSVRAVYSGDPNHQPSQGAPFSLTILPERTQLVASVATLRAPVGTKVRLVASGIPAGATGTLTFRTPDGTVLCAVALPQTFCETTALPAGTTAVAVSYSGDASYAASSASIDVVVDPAPAATAAPAAAGLAVTGATIALLPGLALAVAMLVGGAVLIVARRRSQKRPSAE